MVYLFGSEYKRKTVKKGSTMSEGRGSEDRQMWDATCSTCGVATKVPFEPKAGKPILCKECYFKSKKPKGV